MMKKDYKNTHKSLSLVLRKTSEEQNKLAKRLMSMQLFIDAEKQQEQSLKEYLEEYIVKIQSQKHCRVDEISRYRLFCSKLEKTIIQQHEKIVMAERQLDEIRQASMAIQYKISVLEQMLTKNQYAIEQQEEKRLQKTVDELSARRALQGVSGPST